MPPVPQAPANDAGGLLFVPCRTMLVPMDPELIPQIAIGVSITALLVTIVNAVVGIVNFRLSRFHLVAVDDFTSSYVDAGPKGRFHQLKLKLFSYGAPIFDLKVKLRIWVEPSADSVLDGTCGEYTLEFGAVGELPNPMNPGKGVLFSVERYEGKDAMEDCIRRFKAARLKDVSIDLTCSDGRKVLKRLRNRDTHRKIDDFLGGPRNVGWPLVSTWFATWRLNRQLRRNARVTEGARKLAEKEGIEVKPDLYCARTLHQRRGAAK